MGFLGCLSITSIYNTMRGKMLLSPSLVYSVALFVCFCFDTLRPSRHFQSCWADFLSFSSQVVSNERKIHVQIRRFACCLNMGLNLKILKMSPLLYAESVADQTDHFANVFVRKNVAYGYVVVTTLWRSKVHSSKVHSRRHFA